MKMSMKLYSGRNGSFQDNSAEDSTPFGVGADEEIDVRGLHPRLFGLNPAG